MFVYHVARVGQTEVFLSKIRDTNHTGAIVFILYLHLFYYYFFFSISSLAKSPFLFVIRYEKRNEKKPFSFCMKRDKSQHALSSTSANSQNLGFINLSFERRL